ncbi:FAD-dependent oxidoreductase [Micromonospora maris]|uniref:FAD-dependent oxidoreductase n=1 Tax=Micromonospora maris TaxID=1003110 RepID=UPI00031ECDD0|nr:FAD-dependent oxidoreductase [Micromonospora maris]
MWTTSPDGVDTNRYAIVLIDMHTRRPSMSCPTPSPPGCASTPRRRDHLPGSRRQFRRERPQGAPDAIQAADRWHHLLKNLSDTVEKIVCGHRQCLRTHTDTIPALATPAAVEPVRAGRRAHPENDHSSRTTIDHYSLTLTTSTGTLELAAEQLLVATGRRPLTGGLNLDQVGVTVGRRGEIIVDEHLRTSNRRIWAAGDVTGHPQFVYVAGAHGTLIVDNAFDDADRSMDYTHLPRVTFTTPAITSVGLTDAQAAEQGLDCECRVLPLDYVPRAIVNRDTRGLIKIVAERGNGRIRGVHALADNAGDVIAAAVYAVQAGMTVAQMADTWCPYLTMAEGLKLAAQTFTRDVAKLSCCAS